MKIYFLGSVIQMSVTNPYCMNIWTIFNNLFLDTLLELLFLNVLIPRSSLRNQHIRCCLALSWSSSLDRLYFTIHHRAVFCILFVTFHKINRISNVYRWQNSNWSKKIQKIPTLRFTSGLYSLPYTLNPDEFISNSNI